MKVIFLDIDGVLITHDSSLSRRNALPGTPRTWSPDKRCVRRLNQLTEWTGAKIVVSSVFRKFRGYRAILEGWGVAAPIVGQTPVLREKYRGDEIQAWLMLHPTIEHFVILDDDDDMGRMTTSRLVRTDPKVGFSREDLGRAYEILKG